MATAPRYDTAVDSTGYPAEPKSKGSGCLKGCLIVAVVVAILAIIVGIFVFLNWRKWAANASSAVINQAIDQSSLPPQEKVETKAEVDRAVQAFRNGTMTVEQLGKLMTELGQSPLMTSIMIAGIEQQYLDQSGLTAEEKVAGRQTLNRFRRGVFDKTIPQAAVDSIMQHVAEKGPNGEWKMRQQVGDEDLKKLLDEAKAEADKAQVPAEPGDIDVSAEVKRIVDAALGGQ